MAKENSVEQWKPLKFDFEHTSTSSRVEVSNFGRVRSFNKVSNGNIVKGGMVRGFSTMNLKFYAPREEKLQKKFDALVEKKYALMREITALKKNKGSKKAIKEATGLLTQMKIELTAAFETDLNRRTINYRKLTHQVVAQYFLKKPTSKQVVIGHIDHLKLNNKAGNLKWMTLAENYAHQKNDPARLERLENKGYKRNIHSKTIKLTIAKVALLKKLLLEEKSMPKLVKQFKISHTQILRIKRGINWGDVEAAK